MKISELKKKLKTYGCFQIGEGKKHEWWSPTSGRNFQVPRHMTAEVRKELLKYIKELSGIKL